MLGCMVKTYLTVNIFLPHVDAQNISTADLHHQLRADVLPSTKASFDSVDEVMAGRGFAPPNHQHWTCESTQSGHFDKFGLVETISTKEQPLAGRRKEQLQRSKGPIKRKTITGTQCSYQPRHDDGSF